MSFLQRMFGKKGEVIDDSDVLRNRLFEAVARNDAGDLAALCRANRDRIRRAYADWLKPGPEWFESDPRRVDRYGRNLLAIGQYFAQRLGDSSLLRRLQRPAEESPTHEWVAKLREGSQMMGKHRFEDALALLSELRPELCSFAGFEAKRMESLVVGHLGTCLMQTLRPEKALACFEEATVLCAEARDDEGVRVHLRNHVETLRWLGRHRDAVPWAEKLAGMLETNGEEIEAARCRARARIMAQGEPLLRVLVAVDGHPYEEEEAPVPIQGAVQFLLERNRITLARCEAHLEEGGRQLAGNRVTEALASFSRAMEMDPYAPRSHYETGAIHLRFGRYEEAIRSLEDTERLAPGWFIVRSELWLARQLAAGRFHPDVPGMLGALEILPPLEAVKVTQAMADRFVDLPQAWLFLGEGLQRLGRSAEAETAYRRGLTCAEEPDTRTRLLASLGAVVPHGRAELEEAAALNGHLVSGAMARLLLRSEWPKGDTG